MTGLAAWLRRGSPALARQWAAWVTGDNGRAVVRRGAGTAALAFIVAGLMTAAPWLFGPIAAIWWGVAAGRAGRAVLAREAAELAFVQLLRDAIGPRNGVLLADVLLLLHRDKLLVGWDVADVRVQCAALGIPVRDSIKVEGRVSTGVHIDDLLSAWDVEPTPPPKIRNPSPAGISAGNYPATPQEASASEGVACAVQVPALAVEPDGFEDHLADALSILGQGVNGR
ncbi:hypothetical protein [Streptomyces sp. NBC_01262]|uniref:hypothetical protein n=1 Tax=Streptomyces sp. NBC_01262 TaxID=2903803 RepID=UPI002E326D32|nr:hypothetical protein [Streptomyces sp. NBC_01262]